MKNGIQPGAALVNESLITSKAQLDAFCEKALIEIDDWFKIVFLETRGDSDTWLEKRRASERNMPEPNEESGGVISITISVRPMVPMEYTVPQEA